MSTTITVQRLSSIPNKLWKDIDPKRLRSNSKCKQCNGTGIYAHQLINKKRQPILCSCVRVLTVEESSNVSESK